LTAQASVCIQEPEDTSINTANAVNRCRPGYGASCSFCCGSHNFSFSPECIEELFISRDPESATMISKHPDDACEPKLFRDMMQCPHIGISRSEPGLVGCLTYCDDHMGRKFESFFNGTCKGFHCSAWKELTDRQVLFAAELMKDWYYYSLLVNSLEKVQDLCAEYESPSDVSEETLEEIKAELRANMMDDERI